MPDGGDYCKLDTYCDASSGVDSDGVDDSTGYAAVRD